MTSFFLTDKKLFACQSGLLHTHYAEVGNMYRDMRGVSAQAVSKWERAACYPDITFLPEIAALLPCSVCNFLA